MNRSLFVNRNTEIKYLLTLTLLVSYRSVMNNSKTFTLDEICSLVEMNKRKVRFYIQKGLVDRPEGSGKGSRYTYRHLEQLLAIRKWKDAGISLERIKEIIEAESGTSQDRKPLPPPRTKKEGTIEVWSHLHIADGVELSIEPKRSGLSPEEVRSIFKDVMKHYKTIKERKS